MAHFILMAMLWTGIVSAAGIDRAAVVDLEGLQRPTDLPGAVTTLHRIVVVGASIPKLPPAGHGTVTLSNPVVDTAPLVAGAKLVDCNDVRHNMEVAKETFVKIQDLSRQILSLAEKKKAAELQDTIGQLSKLRANLLDVYPPKYDTPDRKVSYQWHYSLNDFSDIWLYEFAHEHATFSPKTLSWGDQTFNFSIVPLSGVPEHPEIKCRYHVDHVYPPSHTD